jgi:hypothetical protein
MNRIINVRGPVMKGRLYRAEFSDNRCVKKEVTFVN